VPPGGKTIICDQRRKRKPDETVDWVGESGKNYQGRKRTARKNISLTGEQEEQPETVLRGEPRVPLRRGNYANSQRKKKMRRDWSGVPFLKRLRLTPRNKTRRNPIKRTTAVPGGGR